jgi:hypothetical protein
MQLIQRGSMARPETGQRFMSVKCDKTALVRLACMSILRTRRAGDTLREGERVLYLATSVHAVGVGQCNSAER